QKTFQNTRQTGALGVLDDSNYLRRRSNTSDDCGWRHGCEPVPFRDAAGERGQRMPRPPLPSSPPTSAQERAPMRQGLAAELGRLSEDLMRHELELLDAHEAGDFARVVRPIAERLSVSAASWARLSDSIRHSWQA